MNLIFLYKFINIYDLTNFRLKKFFNYKKDVKMSCLIESRTGSWVSGVTPRFDSWPDSLEDKGGHRKCGQNYFVSWHPLGNTWFVVYLKDIKIQCCQKSSQAKKNLPETKNTDRQYV